MWTEKNMEIVKKRAEVSVYSLSLEKRLVTSLYLLLAPISSTVQSTTKNTPRKKYLPKLVRMIPIPQVGPVACTF